MLPCQAPYCVHHIVCELALIAGAAQACSRFEAAVCARALRCAVLSHARRNLASLGKRELACGLFSTPRHYTTAHTQAFTAWGLLSGLFFVLSIAHAFLSINLLDNVAAATGVWCGVAMVVSFVFGVSTGDHVGSPVLAAAALACMLLGVGGITVVYQRTGRCAPSSPAGGVMRRVCLGLRAAHGSDCLRRRPALACVCWRCYGVHLALLHHQVCCIEVRKWILVLSV